MWQCLSNGAGTRDLLIYLGLAAALALAGWWAAFGSRAEAQAPLQGVASVIRPI